MKKLYQYLLLYLLLCTPFIVNAQGEKIATTDKNVLSIEANRKTAAPFSILFNENANLKTADAQEVFTKYLGLRKEVDELRPLLNNVMGNITVDRYQQYFKNIKVEHGAYTITAKDNIISSATGDFYTVDPAMIITPVLNEDQALAKALDKVGATKYKWDLPEEEAFYKKESGNPLATYKPKAELVLVEDFMTPGELKGKLRLAYKFDIYAHQPISRSYIYVDAITGTILLSDAIIKHAGNEHAKNTKTNIDCNNTAVSPFAVGTAASKYSGSVNVITQLISGSHRLQAAVATESYPLHTLNMLKGTSYGAAVEFTDVDNNWSAAEFNNANYDNAALDAHWGAAKVYDYWKARHTRNSYNGSNAVINSYVHLDVNYDNAFWDGIRMSYGDGSNVAGGFTALTGLDVCAHEIGHAVCSSVVGAGAGLTYNRESGALNEGFSDIWGASVEHYADPFEADVVAKSYFLIGEEITVGGGALRSMSNPKLFGQPDTYLGINWQDATVAGCPTPGQNTNDYCGVHTNSGVLNYWFYLIVTGKNGTNDLGNGYSVPAIGWVDAERISFLAETTLATTANYAACRTATINAANTIFGACSLQTEAVTRAWYAVGVGADFVPCVPTITFNGAAQTVTETGTTGATCLKTKTITVPLRISAAATQAATVSFTLAGTAGNGANLDYVISPATVTFPASSAANQNLTITINNDAYVEADETIILNINTVTTTGNAVKGNAFTQYIVTITNDDYPPATAKVLTNQTVYSENFTSGTFSQATSSGASNVWRFGRNAATDAYFGASNNCAYISELASTYTYNGTAGAARYQGASFSTVNYSNMVLKFDYVCLGELNAGTYYDYGSLFYSLDNGTTWLALNNVAYQGQITKVTATVAVPAALNNQANVKLGFRWDNDNSVQNSPPFAIDNIIVTGDLRTLVTVQTAVNAAVSSDQQYLGPNATVNFYDNVSGNVMGTIENLSSFDYGCTTFEVDRAGTSAQFITGDVSGNNKQRLTNKTFRVTPTTNSGTGNYRITLYYSAAEKTGYEAASTRVWVADNGVNNGVKIAKSPGAINSLSTALAGAVRNTIESVGTYGSDFTITSQFTNGFSGFAVGIPPLVVLPVQLVKFAAAKNSAGVTVSWQVTQQINIDNYIVEYSTNGSNFNPLGNITANSMDNATYDFNHIQPVNGNNYYRLKIINNDGSYRYSTIVKINLAAKAGLAISPNPVLNTFTMQYSNSSSIRNISIIDAIGKVVHQFVPASNFGSIVIDAGKYAAGVYLVKMLMDDNSVITQKIVKQ